MKIIINIINVLVILAISTALIIFSLKPVPVKRIQIQAEVKQLQSETFIVESKDSLSVASHTEAEESKEEVVTEEKHDDVKEISKDTSTVEAVSDVLETQVGKMSGYGPNCTGCSGYLASGKYVGDGTIYYSDSMYGTVRILAGDSSYPFGTIVRIKNSRVSSEFLGIILDRGGAIGFGKKFLFDLLYPSEQLALKDEVSYNTTFEILRFGY